MNEPYDYSKTFVNNKMQINKKTFDNSHAFCHTGVMANLISQAKQQVRDHVANGSWGVKSRLAKRADVSPSNLTEMESEAWAPSTTVLDKLLKAIEEIESESSQDEQERLATA